LVTTLTFNDTVKQWTVMNVVKDEDLEGYGNGLFQETSITPEIA
jgi:hypothetical protein